MCQSYVFKKKYKVPWLTVKIFLWHKIYPRKEEVWKRCGRGWQIELKQDHWVKMFLGKTGCYIGCSTNLFVWQTKKQKPGFGKCRFKETKEVRIGHQFWQIEATKTLSGRGTKCIGKGFQNNSQSLPITWCASGYRNNSYSWRFC